MDTLTTILRRRDLLTAQQLDELSLRAQGSTRKLARLIAEEKLLSEASLAEVLAEQAGVPFRSLEDYRVDFDAFPTIPVDWMRQHAFVPLEERDGVLTIAVSDPTDLTTLDLLDRLLERDLLVCVAPQSAIADALQESERNSQVVARITEEFRPALIHENEKGEEVLS
ncbi:MAG: pilus assembly protein PilB, partial [Nitrospira sp.]|nr:pilus assembly protein PilB [Nitrospira sp.]